MIKFDKTELVISGKGGELLFELSEIVKAMNKDIPEELIEIAVNIGLKASKKAKRLKK